MCSLIKNKLLLYCTRHSWMKKLRVLKWAATVCDPSQRTQLSPANSHLPQVKFRDPDCRWQDTWAKSKPVHDAGFKPMVDLGSYCCLTRYCLSHLCYRNRQHESSSPASAADWSKLSEIQVKEFSALQFDSQSRSSGDTDSAWGHSVSHYSGPFWQSAVNIKEHCQEILFLFWLYFLGFFHKRTQVFLVK